MQEQPEEFEPKSFGKASMLLLVHKLNDSFMESESRWPAQRPLGGLVFLRKLIMKNYDSIEEWAQAMSEETNFSLASMDGCLPARLPIFGSKGSSTTGGKQSKITKQVRTKSRRTISKSSGSTSACSTAGSCYMRACFLRFICWYQGRMWSPRDWALALRLFPASRDRAVHFGVVKFASALAVIRSVAEKTTRLYTLADLSLALSMIPVGRNGQIKKKVGYHPDTNLPYTLRPPTTANEESEESESDERIRVPAKSFSEPAKKLHIVILRHGCFDFGFYFSFQILSDIFYIFSLALT